MTFIKLPQPLEEEVLQRLRALPLFSESDGSLQELLENADLGILQAGETLFEQGQPAKYWFLILEGRINKLRYGHDGEERIYQHLKQGQLVAPLAMFMPGYAYPVSAYVVQPATLCRISRSALHKICMEQPQITFRLLQLAGQILNQRIEFIDQLSSCNATQRLACYLQQLYKQGGAKIELPLNQRQLASTLGVRAETISRLLSNWQRKGYLRGNGRSWEVLNATDLWGNPLGSMPGCS